MGFQLAYNFGQNVITRLRARPAGTTCIVTHFSRSISTTSLPELQQQRKFRNKLVECQQKVPVQKDASLAKVLDAGLVTYLLHVRSRVAAYNGQGFYTIGPCGEELLGAIGLCLQPQDSLALHYRHLATNLVRNMKGDQVSQRQILDRAYGYTVSSYDPLSRGRHCLLGGSPNDFLVTSTLASQAPVAVGRGLAVPETSDAISFVTQGDGSVNHSHFLSAVNQAAHMSYLGKSCPVIFGISSNDISISYPLRGWTEKLVANFPVKVYHADGTSIESVQNVTQQAVQDTRQSRKPCAIAYSNLPRRFGHAATDRQNAYLTETQIQQQQDTDPLLEECLQAIQTGRVDKKEILKRFDELVKYIEEAFCIAEDSVKVRSRSEHVFGVSAPIVRFRPFEAPLELKNRMVMRKCMTNIYREILQNFPEARYIGEDVEHGGYYLVTDGLKKEFPNQVQDFLPDETTLLGAAIGYAQSGLVPIVEIPYAKYLDCGMDIFTEACLLYWLSAGKQPNGMVIRLQGFDRGTFGGNFHTHNALYFPPGLDVLCFSTGRDYAAGLRYAFRQAQAGRVVMIVDSTSLLNDRKRISPYPEADEHITFNDIKIYENESDTAVVTYGTGVVQAMQVPRVDVVEVYCLSQIATQLAETVGKYKKVIFADPCKVGNGPLAHLSVELHNRGKLPSEWKCISGPKVYHPLGQDLSDATAVTSTFLTTDDIVRALQDI
jgi:2-oxoisovalerate dehydrogenase E1 component